MTEPRTQAGKARKALIDRLFELTANHNCDESIELMERGYEYRYPPRWDGPDIARLIDAYGAAIEAEARAGYLDLNSPDSERRFIEAGFLDAYLNIHGVADEAEALKMLRHDIAALKEEVVNAEVVEDVCDHVLIDGPGKPARWCVKDKGHAGPHDFAEEGPLAPQWDQRPQRPRPQP